MVQFCIYPLRVPPEGQIKEHGSSRAVGLLRVPLKRQTVEQKKTFSKWI